MDKRAAPAGLKAEPTRRTLLVIHPGSLGDVLLSLPAIRSLRRAYPEQACGLVAGGAVGRLLLACGEIDRLFPMEEEGLTGLLGGGRISAGFQGWVSRAELVAGWLDDAGAVLARRLQALGVTRSILRSPSAVDGRVLHQSDRYGRAVQAGAGDCDERPLRLPSTAVQEAKARIHEAHIAEGQAVVLLHPGSGSPHKCCPPALFGCAVEWLRSAGVVPLLVGGPADDDRLAVVADLCQSPPRVVRDLDLLSMAALVAQAALFIGHDSGLTHVAAWVQVPTVAIFGPTDWRRWAPRGRHVDILCPAPCTCPDWAAIRACRDKPCLQLAGKDLIAACRRHLPVP